MGGDGWKIGVDGWKSGVDGYLECLNEEDLNEPNMAMRRVNERSGDSVLRERSGIVVRWSGIVVIPVFRGRAPKACRETFVNTETSLGKSSRVPEGPFWEVVCLSVERALGALLEKASCPELRSRILPWEAGGPKWGADSYALSKRAQVIVWTIVDIIVWNGEPKWGADIADILGIKETETPRSMVFICFFQFSSVFLLLLADLLRLKPEPIGRALHGVQHPKSSITGSNAPRTPSARNPSAEWGLTPSRYLALSIVYAEYDSD
ncbi:hypothetical protein CRG98_015064 [Punica granatum]|uniref:Uncharacterized protein n=1 Tax=Punica granatum TaxID=22663 RepID=A0A2I0K7H6_PUNGR|nr:hypothetical protein CRG98_015064 [Punica granatum]